MFSTIVVFVSSFLDDIVGRFVAGSSVVVLDSSCYLFLVEFRVFFAEVFGISISAMSACSVFP